MNDMVAIGILLILILYTLRYLVRSFKYRHYKQSFSEAREFVGTYGYKVYAYNPCDVGGTTDVLEALAIINNTPNTIVMDSNGDIIGSLNEYPMKSKQPRADSDDRLRLIVNNAKAENEFETHE